MIIEALKLAHKQKKLIGITTTNLSWDESIIGFVRKVTKNTLLLEEIDEFGFLIGKTEFYLKEIVRIEFADIYQQRLEFVYRNNKMCKKNAKCTIWKRGADLFGVFDLLISNGKVSTIFFTNDELVYGRIIERSKEYIKINNITTNGESDGLSIYLISDISGVRFDGSDEQKISILHDNFK